MSSINYNELMSLAIKNTIKTVLRKISKNKKERFCFLITFDTENKKVLMPKEIKKSFPKEMDVVVENKKSNLIVSGNNFSIDINYNKKNFNITIPFNSIISFLDGEAGIEFKFSNFDEEFGYDCGENDEDKNLNNNLIYFNDLLSKNGK